MVASRFISALLVGTLVASPALAATSPWQEIAPGVQARLVTTDVLDHDLTRAALEIELGEGNKTYWRIPGETGIPTELDFTASVGVSDAEIYWPLPRVETEGGFRDYVYRGTLILPIEFSAAEGAVLDVAVTLGICSDICVPAAASFNMPLTFAAPDQAQIIRIDQAMRETPILWDQPGQPFSTVEAGLDGSLHLGNPDSAIDPASVIVDTGDPGVLFGAPKKSPDGRIWTIKPLGQADGRALEGSPIQLTFATSSGPYTVSRMVAPSQP